MSSKCLQASAHSEFRALITTHAQWVLINIPNDCERRVKNWPEKQFLIKNMHTSMCAAESVQLNNCRDCTKICTKLVECWRYEEQWVTAFYCIYSPPICMYIYIIYGNSSPLSEISVGIYMLYVFISCLLITLLRLIGYDKAHLPHISPAHCCYTYCRKICVFH